VEVKLKQGVSLKPFRKFLREKNKKQAVQLLRRSLFVDRFDNPPWYKVTGVKISFKELNPPYLLISTMANEICAIFCMKENLKLF